MEKVNQNKRVCAMLFDLVLVNSSVVSIMKILGTNVTSVFLSMVISFVYFSFRDCFGGKSMGKFIVGLKVDEIGRGSVGIMKSLTRNIPLSWVYLFILAAMLLSIGNVISAEVYSTTYKVLMFMFFLSLLIEYMAIGRKSGLRIGDRIAKTNVVDVAPTRPAWLFAVIGTLLFVINILLGAFMRM